ncbi:MAG: redox-regulated ATPase YchF [Candidatus Thermoplasmatota archaeon]|nr:redox-regulated ATPase YchF [Candidatus Thermoplasmatota archaeon]
MGTQIGIVGKPNVGKTTFFNAATNAHAEMASYPFTTIDANRGVMYARTSCPCREFDIKCNPHNSECREGIRYVPIEAIDVAGLVPKAHEGRGLGNKFLDDLRQASCLIHIIDISGSTDDEGRMCNIGEHDPEQDVQFLEEEIDYWICGIIQKDWEHMSRKCKLEGKKIDKALTEKLTGLGVKEGDIHAAIKNAELQEDATKWCSDDLLALSSHIRKVGKPILLALNKCDKAPDAMVKKMTEGYTIPTSAEAELALSRAAEKDLVAYKPGDSSFTILDKSMDEKHLKALEYIKTHVMEKYGGTGVQKCIDKAVFDMLDLIAVYPVEDDHHLTDKKGNVLPDVFLLPEGSTAIDLAYKVHTDLGERFIRAVDARTQRIAGADHELKNGDIIRIIAK